MPENWWNASKSSLAASHLTAYPSSSSGIVRGGPVQIIAAPITNQALIEIAAQSGEEIEVLNGGDAMAGEKFDAIVYFDARRGVDLR